MSAEHLWDWDYAKRSRVEPTCERCDRIHVAADVKAMNLFNDAPIYYRAVDGTDHETRERAQDWLCRQRAT